MGIDVKQVVKDRDEAFIAFVLNDDWEPVKQYCATYGIAMPMSADVMAAGIYKAVQEVTTIPNDIKVKAAIKCMQLGFEPFVAPVMPKVVEQ